MQKKYFLILLYMVGTAIFLPGCKNTKNQAGAEPTPTPTVIPTATATPAVHTEKTIITPSLSENINPDQNLLWCATLQLAWNELFDLAEGPIAMENEPPVVTLLNQQKTLNLALDEASYLAKAGFVTPEIVKDLEETHQQKFPDQPFPQELQGLPQNSLMAYAYLLKTLPFEWAFTRFTKPFNYQETPVASFGLAQYMSGHPTDDNLARQVSVLDYQNGDDFILELHTTSQADRLILAKISPAATLQATLDQVLKRVESAQPTAMQNLETVIVPVIDLDRTRQFPELCGRKITAPNAAINGKALSLVEQRIQFRLDETGAVLESKAVFVSAMPPRKFVFDKPFLLMLIRQDASTPYFVLWVNNADILAPFTS
ncbi:hypothetical protein U27_01557 [Candidatus Vecturithrix granuli]|uniref:Serpin domain-containing protein n=1 Tax=Vecturithrix granuli TaxID=1499967 RepID=A0A081CAQ1_VECG1|nr:hypothetical protein U27_01557 [Candidatus Vecturithrix granuli]